jgi:hypothetical protein
MKIISLIKGTRPLRTNKEQNTVPCKLCFDRPAWRGLDDLVLDNELAVRFWVFVEWFATMTGKNMAVCAPAGQAEQAET